MITSTSNPRIKALARLRRRSVRDKDGIFVIEGRRVVTRAHTAGWPLREVCVAPELSSPEGRELTDRLRAAGLPVTELGENAFRKICYRQHPDGVLAIGEIVHRAPPDLSLPQEPLVLVVERIEKPGNLGAMLRIADGAGADAVVVADPATDVFNPNVVRASQGALFSVPIATGSVEDVRAWLAHHHIQPFPAMPDGTRPPWTRSLVGSVALVVGSEHAGLSAAWRRDPSIALPMLGTGDSLNAAATAAVVLYEAHRQRSS